MECSDRDSGRQVVGMGFAGTELSPELSEKIKRLETENLRLKSILEEHDTDKVASIVNALDDEKRISNNYEVSSSLS